MWSPLFCLIPEAYADRCFKHMLVNICGGIGTYLRWHWNISEVVLEHICGGIGTHLWRHWNTSEYRDASLQMVCPLMLRINIPKIRGMKLSYHI